MFIVKHILKALSITLFPSMCLQKTTRKTKVENLQYLVQNHRQALKSYTHVSTNRGKSELSTQAFTSKSSAQARPAAIVKDYWAWNGRRKNWYHLRKDGPREWHKREQKKQ